MRMRAAFMSWRLFGFGASSACCSCMQCKINGVKVIRQVEVESQGSVAEGPGVGSEAGRPRKRQRGPEVQSQGSVGRPGAAEGKAKS